VTDPVDARLLGVVAELGRAAVHEVAARLGMDPRDVAARLVALSATGIPVLVGVECDPNGVRAALARMTMPAPGTPTGAYAMQAGYGPPPPSGPVPAYGAPVPYPQQGYPSGPQPVHGGPYPSSGPFPAQTGPPSNPFPAPMQQQAPPPPNAPMNTWGPPQTASWARGDRPAGTPPVIERTQPTTRGANGGDTRTGKVGATLQTQGLEGEQLSIQLIEVVDPADYLFTAAGYRLQEGERSVVVHTELTNRGTVPFQTLPDLYLVLVTPDGQTISKAPVSLSSRPPHRIGVAPGETAGGHTVYVVPEATEVSSVRWSPRPDETSRTLTWTLDT
jgi:hypothetical protein